MFETGKGAAQIVDEKGLKQVSDTGELEKIIDDLIAANPGQVILVHLALGKIARQLPLRGLITRDQQHPAGTFVEAMYQVRLLHRLQ